MAVLGLTYGVQLANLMNVANSIAGSEEMVLVFALELFLEGVGSLIGAPLTSKYWFTSACFLLIVPIYMYVLWFACKAVATHPQNLWNCTLMHLVDMQLHSVVAAQADAASFPKQSASQLCYFLVNNCDM